MIEKIEPRLIRKDSYDDLLDFVVQLSGKVEEVIDHLNQGGQPSSERQHMDGGFKAGQRIDSDGWHFLLKGDLVIPRPTQPKVNGGDHSG